MEDIVWCPIKGYENLYEINKFGDVKSLHKKNKGLILKPRKDHNGYLLVNLTKNKKKTTYKIHRLVAETFIPNSENKPCVDHINTIRDDNRVENLKWVTHKENNNNLITRKHNKDNHWDCSGKNNPHFGKLRGNFHGAKPVYCIELDKKWDCIKDCAEELNLCESNISAVCKGKYRQIKGYHFKYIDK